MGGLAGAIIVNPTDSYVPPNLFNYTRQLLLFSHFLTDTLNPTNDPLKVHTYTSLRGWTGDSVNPQVSWYNTNQQDVYMTNGQFQPTYNMVAGQPIIFDMLNAVGDHNLEIQIMSTVGGSTSSLPCTITLLAMDGIYLAKSRVVTMIAMVPGTRMSAMVQCNNPGTYYLQSYASSDRTDFASNMVRYNQLLLNLVVTGTASSGLATIDLTKITRPSYLTDLQNAKVDHHWETNQNLRTSGPSGDASLGIGRECSSLGLDPTINLNCQYVVFNGHGYPLSIQRHIGVLGTIEQLSIIGAGTTPAHNIHVHVNHFQVTSFGQGAGGVNYYTKYWGEIGDWRDTVPANPGNTSVRYPLNSFTGDIIMHCHILMHEDEGMMASFLVVDKGSACTWPDICYTNGTVTANALYSNTNVGLIVGVVLGSVALLIGVAITIAIVSIIIVLIVRKREPTKQTGL
ncbi:hypothetical protein AKO1_007348 [Acrasis kona]|uniref:Plastocyanin-like domain-containing protein n=1 Tax=Acrasis kona TaxID=1008807 RepID=A0AAW2YSI9_9EUKA